MQCVSQGFSFCSASEDAQDNLQLEIRVGKSLLLLRQLWWYWGLLNGIPHNAGSTKNKSCQHNYDLQNPFSSFTADKIQRSYEKKNANISFVLCLEKFWHKYSTFWVKKTRKTEVDSISSYSFEVNEIGPISYSDNERKIFRRIVFGTRICCIFNIQNKVSFHLIQKYICWQWRGLQWVTGPRWFSFLLICQTVIELS